MQPVTISISELNNLIKITLESIDSFNDIWISGEISQFKHYVKGNHYYFYLSDDTSTINCVVYSSFIKLIQFKPKVGQHVFARGKLQYFQNKGTLMFQVSYMTIDGSGKQIKAFNELKNQLEKEGYFNQKNKLDIPKFPIKIGVITAPNSAAFGDFISTLRQENTYSNVYLLPSVMQGEHAALSIIEQIDYAITCQMNVIVIIRGGGSSQDLNVFNEENLCRKLFSCPIPIITGIGHQTDESLADLIADKALITPTACAYFLAEPFQIIKQSIKNLFNNFEQYFYSQINLIEQQVSLKQTQLSSTVEKKIVNYKHKIELLCNHCLSLNPIRKLKEGYCIASQQNTRISSVSKLSKNDIITTEFFDGSITSNIKEITICQKKTQ